MAKKKESRADQVRAAVEQAFEATTQNAGPMRERAQELAEELVGAASRFREVIDELRPPTGDELGALRGRLDALERRVAELEAEKAATAPKKPAAARKPRAGTSAATTKPRAARASGTAAGAKGASASPGASTAKRGKAAAPRKPRTSGS